MLFTGDYSVSAQRQCRRPSVSGRPGDRGRPTASGCTKIAMRPKSGCTDSRGDHKGGRVLIGVRRRRTQENPSDSETRGAAVFRRRRCLSMGWSAPCTRSTGNPSRKYRGSDADRRAPPSNSIPARFSGHRPRGTEARWRPARHHRRLSGMAGGLRWPMPNTGSEPAGPIFLTGYQDENRPAGCWTLPGRKAKELRLGGATLNVACRFGACGPPHAGPHADSLFHPSLSRHPLCSSTATRAQGRAGPASAATV